MTVRRSTLLKRPPRTYNIRGLNQYCASSLFQIKKPIRKGGIVRIIPQDSQEECILTNVEGKPMAKGWPLPERAIFHGHNVDHDHIICEVSDIMLGLD